MKIYDYNKYFRFSELFNIQNEIKSIEYFCFHYFSFEKKFVIL